MKYGSVCSGIEAASVAWHHLGWEAQWFSEIEHFPSEVLKYRFPAVENLGDMTKLTTNETFKASTIDLLVGGTPCQSFSVAGLRRGLADPRGNLMLTFLSLADAKKPRWIVWENVPGVLSSNGGKDFGTFLGALGELGYGFAYRVLDAQHFGVAQRRRRVFVVGYLGDWRVAAAVLFERESLQRDIKPSRKKRQEVAPDAQRGVGEAGDVSCVGGNNSLVQQPFRKVRRAQSDSDFETWEKDETANTLNCFDVGDVRSTNVVAQPIAFKVRGGCEGGGKGYLGQEERAFTISATQDQQIAQPIAVDTYNQTVNERTSQTIGSSASYVNHYAAVMQPIPINTMTMLGRPSDDKNPRMGLGIGNPGEPQNTLTKTHSHAVATGMAIRRLTPIETELLQGFPRNWTKIPYRNKPADQCPDGPRYKACGNSMAVPVMRWIGERIQLIDTIVNG